MKSDKQKITRSVFAEAQPTEKEYVIWDSRVPGFGLRVRPSGNKSYTFVYRTQGGRSSVVKRVTIKAATPDVALEQAKALAARHYGGGDPAAARAEEKVEAERKSKTPTVGEVLDAFIEHHARTQLKPTTCKEYDRIVQKILKPAIGETKIDVLEPKEVATMYQRLLKQPRVARGKAKAPTTPAVSQASGAIRVLSSAMSWAEESGLRPAGSNPARIRIKATRRRQRLFSDNEVSRLLKSTEKLEAAGNITAPVALGIRLLFATGCRAGEITGLRWENVDLDVGILRWPDTKTGYLEKPITYEARALIEGADRTLGVAWVCPSLAGRQLRVETLEGGFERVMKAAEVIAGENATLHLIRHWFATKTYTDKSIPLPLQMAIVGHGSVATAMRYTHIDREELANAARAAADRRAEGIRTAEKRGQVVTLRSNDG